MTEWSHLEPRINVVQHHVTYEEKVGVFTKNRFTDVRCSCGAIIGHAYLLHSDFQGQRTYEQRMRKIDQKVAEHVGQNGTVTKP